MSRTTKIRRRIAQLLWGTAALLVVLFAVRLWVGDVYTVVSNSMEPFLSKGDRVWVRHGLGTPERHTLMAFRNRAGQSVVKRLEGLPGEQILIDQSGDLWVDNQRPERPDFWVPVFDDRLGRVADHFLHGGLQIDPWKEGQGYWEVDARGIPQGHSQGLLRFRDGVDSGRLLEDGTQEHGTESVGDVRLRLEAFVPEPGGILRFELSEQSDTFQVQLGLDHPEKGRIILTHLHSNSGELAKASIAPVPVGRWFHVTYLNRDNRIELWIDGGLALVYEYDANLLNFVGSIGERVRFGATGTVARFRSIRIDRDVTYTQRGEFGVGKRLTLSPDQFFLLGDNSVVSEDCRILGPVERGKMLGRVVARVWPWHRRGRL